MLVEERPITSIRPYADNPRINDQAVEAVALDPFGGSGSTLIAAEQTGRHAFLMELDPLYCDVIVQRWQNFAGRQTERQEHSTTSGPTLRSPRGSRP